MNLIITANKNISNQKAQEIMELWKGLKKISNTTLKTSANSTFFEYHPESHKIITNVLAKNFEIHNCK